MKTSLKAALSLVKHNKSKYVIDAVIMLVANASAALIAFFFGLAIGAAASGDYKLTLIYLIVGWLCNVLHSIFWHSGDYWIIKKLHKDTFEFRNIAFQKIWQFQYASFIDKPTSKLASSDIRLQENLKQVYNSFHYGFFSILIYYSTIIITMFSIAWQTAILYLIFVVIAVTVLKNKAKSIARTSAKFADTQSEIDGKTYDSVANFTNVFSFTAKKKEINQNNTNIKKLFGSYYTNQKVTVGFSVLASVMIRVGLWVSVLLVNWYLLKSGQITPSGFAAAIGLLISFTGQYWALMKHIAQFGNRIAAFDENYSYLFGDKNIIKEYYSEQALGQKKSTPLQLNKSISLNKINFAYPDRPDEKILNNINITIKKGEKVGIVGVSGGGKSTIIKLLLGFYEPVSGSILVDGAEVTPKQLQRLISYVPQDTTLFQESVAYNIGYAVEGKITLDMIKKAAKKAHAAEFISGLKDGYQTLVGERGIKLSLGQRQRIAIARAFIKDTDLLVLDEATSSLDSVTEKNIQDSLEQLWKHKTVVAIAHRLSTLNNVDRIIVIDQGQVVEQGTKDELLAKKGHFAKLWSHQKNGLI